MQIYVVENATAKFYTAFIVRIKPRPAVPLSSFFISCFDQRLFSILHIIGRLSIWVVALFTKFAPIELPLIHLLIDVLNIVSIVEIFDRNVLLPFLLKRPLFCRLDALL